MTSSWPTTTLQRPLVDVPEQYVTNAVVVLVDLDDLVVRQDRFDLAAADAAPDRLVRQGRVAQEPLPRPEAVTDVELCH